MATGTAGDVGVKHSDLQVKPCITKRISWDDVGTSTANARITVGWLPPRSIITGGGVWVITGFDDTNGDDLEIGLSGSDDDLYASAIDVNTSDSISSLDDLADANRYSATARQVTANFTTAPSGNGTVGELIIYIEYVVAPATS